MVVKRKAIGTGGPRRVEGRGGGRTGRDGKLEEGDGMRWMGNGDGRNVDGRLDEGGWEEADGWRRTGGKWGS